MNSDNVFKILSIAVQSNPKNKSFRKLIENLTIDAKFTRDVTTLVDVGKIIKTDTADTLAEIKALEKRMKKATPEIKERISRYIERGAIANKIKKLTSFKCLVCEQLGDNPFSFKKSNGDYYVESHHVEQVSKLKKGSLSVANLITVCANHHRQLHYGDCEVLENNEEKFVFRIEDNEIEIKKIKLIK